MWERERAKHARKLLTELEKKLDVLRSLLKEKRTSAREAVAVAKEMTIVSKRKLSICVCFYNLTHFCYTVMFDWRR